MSQFTIEESASQVNAFCSMISPIMSNHPGICTTETTDRGRFHPLPVFFLNTTQLSSIPARLPKLDWRIHIYVSGAQSLFPLCKSQSVPGARMCRIERYRKERAFTF